jgi:hypothetical protein
MTVTFAMPIAPTSRSVEDTGELIDLGLDIVTAVAHPHHARLTTRVGGGIRAEVRVTAYVDAQRVAHSRSPILAGKEVTVRAVRRGLIIVVVLGVLIVGSVTAWVRFHRTIQVPGCTVTASPDPSSGTPAVFTLTPQQADNAATIAAVGGRLGMPAHAVTVALATALQESKLRNLPGGDRDSLGLFQQRPSQGWGTSAQILDPVYAATAFYARLSAQPGWAQLSVTEAAQLVQRSAAPLAYAQWESEARAAASALTGQSSAALSCHSVTVGAPSTDLVAIAESELGTAVLSGPHPTAQGWAMGTWLVAHAARVGVDQVTFDGRTWTAVSGAWSQPGVADGVLSLHRSTGSPSAGPQ